MINKLSLCIIAKNEEKNLRKSLKYLYLFADQIIFVDTGSADNTKKIAGNYGCEIYNYKWDDSFSNARNFSYSKAECPWIMWLDADDIIDKINAKKIAKIKKGLDEKVDGIFLKRNLEYSENNYPILSHLFLYITPRNKYKWHYRAYNSLEPIDKKDEYNYQIFPDIEINHWKETERKESRNNQTLKLLKKEENKTPYILFALSEEYRAVKNFKQSIKFLKKFLNRAKKDKNFDKQQIYLAELNIGKNFYLDKKYKKMQKHLKKIAKHFPQYAEAWIMLGDFEYTNKRFLNAIEYYESAIRCKFPKLKQVAFDNRLYTYYPYDMIGSAYAMTGDFKKALKYKKFALEITPAIETSIKGKLQFTINKLIERI